MRRILLATTIAASIFGAPAYADLPVIDLSALGQWAKELQQQAQQLQPR